MNPKRRKHRKKKNLFKKKQNTKNKTQKKTNPPPPACSSRSVHLEPSRLALAKMALDASLPGQANWPPRASCFEKTWEPFPVPKGVFFESPKKDVGSPKRHLPTMFQRISHFDVSDNISNYTKDKKKTRKQHAIGYLFQLPAA